ncbi:MAG: Nif3-like dinuclear metal center hexameric protein, partial [Flammeovirgaceae bacterium]|nr:Nif3-like dinuclear metal center hexameric protein [Flammeovirgaceae bacterium]
MTILKNIVGHLEQMAPLAYQESYDNAGLLTGNYAQEIKKVLVSLDCTEEVVEEAVQNDCQLIVAHHPIVFKGLKKITGSNYVERTVLKAIKHDLAIYAIHTNLDAVHTGVNHKISQRLGLQNTRILQPKTDTLGKLVTFVPHAYAEKVLDALAEAGAGNIGNYQKCSFQLDGTGTFRPNERANPFFVIKCVLVTVQEYRIDVFLPL